MNKPTRTMSKSNEWYTPSQYIRAAREVMGSIELDPASCELANATVQAERYYTQKEDGLLQSWKAHTLWLNPPYGRTNHISNQETWTCKLIAEYEAGDIEQAILLVNAATDTNWFQRLWEYPICFTDHRIAFFRIETAGESTIGSAFVYLGPQVERFAVIFSKFGRVVRSISPQIPTLWSA